MSPVPLSEERTAPNESLAVADAELAAEGGEGKGVWVKRMFSDIAPRYDLLNRVLSLNIDRIWRKKAITALNWRSRPDGLWLDLCAGTLDVAATLVKNREFRGSVVGADFAVPMLAHGKGKAPAGKILPVGADAMALPFGDSCLQGAIVAFGIRNVSSLEACLREVRRVLNPGARFVILEFSTPPSRIIRSAYHAYFHNILPLIGRLVSGHASAYRYLPMSVANFPDVERLAELMRNAGFVQVSWKHVSFGIAAIHIGSVPE